MKKRVTLLLLVSLLSGTARLSWFVRDNLSIGARFGYGKVVFDKEMTDYERFQINIEYRSNRTPKYVAVVTSSSAFGDYFTGGTGSVLYLDEFAFLYEPKK